MESQLQEGVLDEVEQVEEELGDQVKDKVNGADAQRDQQGHDTARGELAAENAKVIAQLTGELVFTKEQLSQAEKKCAMLQQKYQDREIQFKALWDKREVRIHCDHRCC